MDMDQDFKRRMVYSALSFILGWMATRVALYLTNKLLGEPDEII